MVVKLMDWSCNIYCIIISLSKGPMLELGGIVGLKVRLGQFASVELGELGKLGFDTIIFGLPSIKSYIHLSTFFVA
jgi:hypothetical protein